MNCTTITVAETSLTSSESESTRVNSSSTAMKRTIMLSMVKFSRKVSVVRLIMTTISHGDVNICKYIIYVYITEIIISIADSHNEYLFITNITTYQLCTHLKFLRIFQLLTSAVYLYVYCLLTCVIVIIVIIIIIINSHHQCIITTTTIVIIIITTIFIMT